MARIADGCTQRIELGEQRPLHREVFDDALDHEVARRQVGEVVGGDDPGEDRAALVGVEPALGDLAVEPGGDRGDRGVGRLAGARSQHHVVTGTGRHLRQATAHDPRPDDSHREDVCHADTVVTRG